MDSLELLPVTSSVALDFFYKGLRRTELVAHRPKDEALHVATVLASYAQVSQNESLFLPPSKDLSEFFHHFVIPHEVNDDFDLLLNACAQSLWLNGFFRDYMKRRHNVKWYDELARSFYDSASNFCPGPQSRDVFLRMRDNFPTWAKGCRDLNRKLQENRYLLRLH